MQIQTIIQKSLNNAARSDLGLKRSTLSSKGVRNIPIPCDPSKDRAVCSSTGRVAIIAAVNDEDRCSITDLDNHSKDLDSIHQKAMFSSNISAVEHHEVVTKPIYPPTGDPTEIPLYKVLKRGDKVFARTSTGVYERAEILSVVHGGYPSARYDIRFHLSRNGTTETLPWKDIKLTNSLNGDGQECSGRDLIMNAGGGSDDVDEFGRSKRRKRSAEDIIAATNKKLEKVSIYSR